LKRCSCTKYQLESFIHISITTQLIWKLSRI
jgi:hypothetical protein